MAGIEEGIARTPDWTESPLPTIGDDHEAPLESVEPSARSKSYMRGAHQEAMAFNPKEKKLRDRAKARLTRSMIVTIENHGIGEQVRVDSKHTGFTYEDEAKSTPVVPYPLSEDEVIGVSLFEERVVIPRFRNGLFLNEEVVTGKIHLVEHDLETGEQIGRNSAGVLGSDFVTNSAKGPATRQQIEGMNDTVRYVNRYLSSLQGVVPQVMEPDVPVEPHQ